MSFSPKTILITGGYGFIGSNFLNTFVPRFPDIKFINIDKLTYAANLNNLEFLPQNFGEFNDLKQEYNWQSENLETASNYFFENGDILDLNFLEKVCQKYEIDSIIHFAAESHVDLSIKNPTIFVETNILGTQNLLTLAKKYQIQRFHHVSTDEVYGQLPIDKPEIKFTENTPLAPNSPYSASKVGSDFLVRAYIETFDLNAVITRCSNNYGPYQDKTKLIPKFITNLLNGQKVPLYASGQNVRDWLFVIDHCEAIWEVFTRGNKGEVYNIGGNNEMTNLQITKEILKLTGRDESYIEYVTDRPGHDLRYAIDASKIKNDLGWGPRFSFEDGIAKTFEFYKSSRN
jgi:dTDP-glucose 4,6-dehydratase